MVRVLKVSKSFMLGVCECGCKRSIAIRSKHRQELARYTHGHNLEPQYGPENPSWKGGRFLDSHGYRLIWKPDYPHTDKKGYVLEHRWIMEQYLGRYLTDNEEIHHINGNKVDNRIENLQLMTTSEHTTYEMKKRWRERRFANRLAT